jgi:hypothetical protein
MWGMIPRAYEPFAANSSSPLRSVSSHQIALTCRSDFSQGQKDASTRRAYTRKALYGQGNTKLEPSPAPLFAVQHIESSARAARLPRNTTGQTARPDGSPRQTRRFSRRGQRARGEEERGAHLDNLVVQLIVLVLEPLEFFLQAVDLRQHDSATRCRA